MKVLTRLAAAGASALGALLLVLASVVVAVNLYYRPTIEYTYTDGRPSALPSWMTADVITGIAATILAAAGGVLFWLGRRCRRS